MPEGRLLANLPFCLVGSQAEQNVHCAILPMVLSKENCLSRAQQTLGVPFEILHLDELDSTLYSFKDSAPCVVAVRGSECSILLSKAELALCDSEVERFFDSLKAKLGKP